MCIQDPTAFLLPWFQQISVSCPWSCVQLTRIISPEQDAGRKWMKAYELTSRRVTVSLGEIRHIYERLKHTDKWHITLLIRDIGLQWVEKLPLSGEIRERHAIYLSGDLEWWETQAPSFHAASQRHLPMQWLSFLSLVSHGQEIDHPWTSSVVGVLAVIPPSSHPYPLSAAPADFFNTDAVSRICFYLQGDG